MAHCVERDGNYYIYDKVKLTEFVDGKYVNRWRDIKPIPLGRIGKDAAGLELAKYKIKRGKGKLNLGETPMSLVFENYLKYLVDEHYAPKTIREAERLDVGPYISTVKTVADVTEESLKAWDAHLRAHTFERGPQGARVKKKLSNDTRAHRIRQLNAFIGWMVSEKYLPERPHKIPVPEGRKDAGFDPGVAFIKEFLAGLSPKTQPISYIIFYGGVRISEILPDEEEYTALQHEWINRAENRIELPRTKNGDARNVYLPKFIIDMIPAGTGDVFPFKDGVVRDAWKKRLLELGVTRRLRLHDGRVASASEFWRKKKDMKGLMQRYGWKDVKTAMHYVKSTEEEQKAAANEMFQ